MPRLAGQHSQLGCRFPITLKSSVGSHSYRLQLPLIRLTGTDEHNARGTGLP